VGSLSGQAIHPVWCAAGDDRRHDYQRAGFVLLSFAHGPVLYFLAWAILGTGGSATLATATYILLNEVAGRGARRAIGA